MNEEDIVYALGEATEEQLLNALQNLDCILLEVRMPDGLARYVTKWKDWPQ